MGNLPCQQEKIQNTYSLKLYFQGINSPGLGTGMGHSTGTSLAEQLTKEKGRKKTMLGATCPHQARLLPWHFCSMQRPHQSCTALTTVLALFPLFT